MTGIIQMIGGITIVMISSLFLWAYTYKPPYNMFWIISYSAMLLIGIAQTIIGMANNRREKL